MERAFRITEACQGTFKIQEGPLSSDTKKMLYLLKCQICGEVRFVGKAKTKFCYRFNNYESTHRAFRNGKQKVPRKSFHTIYCLDGHWNWWLGFCDFWTTWNTWTVEKKKKRFGKTDLKPEKLLPEKQEHLS